MRACCHHLYVHFRVTAFVASQAQFAAHIFARVRLASLPRWEDVLKIEAESRHPPACPEERTSPCTRSSESSHNHHKEVFSFRSARDSLLAGNLALRKVVSLSLGVPRTGAMACFVSLLLILPIFSVSAFVPASPLLTAEAATACCLGRSPHAHTRRTLTQMRGPNVALFLECPHSPRKAPARLSAVKTDGDCSSAPLRLTKTEAESDALSNSGDKLVVAVR